MTEPTALAPSAKNVQVVAPIGYGSEGPYRLPAALFGYHPRQNDYSCESLINSKTISVFQKIQK